MKKKKKMEEAALIDMVTLVMPSKSECWVCFIRKSKAGTDRSTRATVGTGVPGSSIKDSMIASEPYSLREPNYQS